VKTLRSQKLRMLLTHRKLLRCKAIAIGGVRYSMRETVDRWNGQAASPSLSCH